MNILTSLEAANTQAGITTPISFANIREFQSFVDSFEFDDYPINIIVPPSFAVTYGQGYKVKQVMNLQGWIMTRLTEDVNDYRSKLIEPTYMQPMRELANKFITALWRDSSLVDEEFSTTTGTITPEYGFLNNRMFGVSYVVSIPLIEAVC